MCMCLSTCVRERQKDRDRDQETGKQSERIRETYRGGEMKKERGVRKKGIISLIIGLDNLSFFYNSQCRGNMYIFFSKN